ncbi:hypothetical protein BH11PSE2_BH11PSE2_00960 [soil metagenome]
MPAGAGGRLGRLIARAAAPLFVFGVLVVGFAAGFAAKETGWPPVVPHGRVAAANLWNQLTSRATEIVGPSDIPATSAQASRLKTLIPNSNTETLWFLGGPYRFLDYCPTYGCLAIELDRTGKLVSSIPNRPSEFEKPPMLALKYDEMLFRAKTDIIPKGMWPIPGGGGDFVMSMQFRGAFPYGGGVARMRRDGTVVWYRRDHTHHWQYVSDREIATVSMKARRAPVVLKFDLAEPQVIACTEVMSEDIIRILDFNGKQTDEFSVLDALIASPYRGHLIATLSPCDITHLNFIAPVGAALAADLPGVAADDFLISMRNLSAFAVIGRRSHAIERFYTGGFSAQHDVMAGPNGKVLMFDNLGGGPEGGPSRVLEFDPRTGNEKTVFPTPQTQIKPGFAFQQGYIDVSKDGKRALVSYSTIGRAYEIELDTGVVITSFDNLNDFRGARGYFKGDNSKAVRATLSQAFYGHAGD